MSKRWTGVAIAGALLALAACSNPYFFWLRPGATAGALVFGHGYKRHGKSAGNLDRLEVSSCGGYLPDLRKIPSKKGWWIWREYGDTTPGPKEIRYGETPAGYTLKRAAAPLTPGCYELSGGLPGYNGSVSFWIREGGAAVELTRAELDSAYAVSDRHARASFRADTLAGERCLAAYRAAPDSAAKRRVDRMVPYDTTRFADLKCADLAQYDPAMRAAGGTPTPFMTWPTTAPILGSFVDDYGNHFEITSQEWVQMPHGRFRIVKWVDDQRYLIARNDTANVHAPGLWTRIDWVQLQGMPPWEWAFCLSAYEAPTADSAEATNVTQPETPRTGCNGYPYSRMKRVPKERIAAVDSVAKQKCREAYAAVGADGAGLQSVDDMVPFDTTRYDGPSCGTLRRQDPRLKGAE